MKKNKINLIIIGEDLQMKQLYKMIICMTTDY